MQETILEAPAKQMNLSEGFTNGTTGETVTGGYSTEEKISGTPDQAQVIAGSNPVAPLESETLFVQYHLNPFKK